MSINEETLSKSFGLAEKSYFLYLCSSPPPQYSRWFCFNIGNEILNSVSGGILYSSIGSKKLKKYSWGYVVWISTYSSFTKHFFSSKLFELLFRYFWR